MIEGHPEYSSLQSSLFLPYCAAFRLSSNPDPGDTRLRSRLWKGRGGGGERDGVIIELGH